LPKSTALAQHWTRPQPHEFLHGNSESDDEVGVKCDRETPRGLDLHLIADNYATHKHPRVQVWLARHPRFTMPGRAG
jgi:hypothetical protein